ncbi:centrosome-associated protein CEP250-like [Athene noctua]|uniref:centrosome-associated protein CEP250-like n=1 Tax=Athene noctua TaxID=126797 RepID=UPI003EB97396
MGEGRTSEQGAARVSGGIIKMTSITDVVERPQASAAAEGEQVSWLSEKRLLSQRLGRLQQAVARLECEKTKLKQLIAGLRRALEQVERERRN